METYNSSVCSFGYYWTINIQNCHRGPLLRIISRRIISGKSTIQTSDCFIQFYQQIITTWLTSLSRISWTVSTIIVHIKVGLLRQSKKFFCINVNKNAKEKLSFGFWVSKMKTDTAGACFPNSWCNQPPPITYRVN